MQAFCHICAGETWVYSLILSLPLFLSLNTYTLIRFQSQLCGNACLEQVNPKGESSNTTSGEKLTLVQVSQQ